MEPLYAWIRNLAGYFVFLAVLEQLMGGSRSGRYVRFFAGIILILVVLQPLTGSLRLEDALVREYEALVFQYEAEDLCQELSGAERRRLGQIVDQYQAAVAETVGELARAEGYEVQGCTVQIGRDSEKENFGEVTDIRLILGKTEDVEDADSEKLKRRLAAYYNLEEEHVEIQIVEREG